MDKSLGWDLKLMVKSYIMEHPIATVGEKNIKKKKHSKGCIFTYFNENKLSLLKVINCEII